MSAAGGLAQRLARAIAAQGPISLVAFMGEANAHYYATRDPLGAAGDFTTAPEIHQMFGEMLGLWLADVWQRAGAPQNAAYVELGPGRGTLAGDALRVMARFGCRPEVHLVETSPALRAAQARVVPVAHWHDDLSTLPQDRPLLVLANEFLDALPVRQMVQTPHGWRERLVAHDGARFLPVAGRLPMDAAVPEGLRAAAPGAIVEACPAAAAITDELAHRLAAQGGAGLIVDYGYAQAEALSTLQALKAHARADPFADPGEADLTCLVDFATTAAVARRAGARVRGPQGQGAFLQALGMGARAEALARATPARTQEVARAFHRLVDAAEMGTLFQVLALESPAWPEGAGFPA